MHYHSYFMSCIRMNILHLLPLDVGETLTCLLSHITSRLAPPVCSRCCAERQQAPFYAVPAAQLRPRANGEKMCKLPSAVEKQIL